MGLSRISAWGLIEPFAECPFTIFGISPAVPMAVLGLILLVILVPVEKRVEQKNGIALLPQSFLKTPQVRAGLVASAITFFFLGVPGDSPVPLPAARCRLVPGAHGSHGAGPSASPPSSSRWAFRSLCPTPTRAASSRSATS